MNPIGSQSGLNPESNLIVSSDHTARGINRLQADLTWHGVPAMCRRYRLGLLVFFRRADFGLSGRVESLIRSSD